MEGKASFVHCSSDQQITKMWLFSCLWDLMCWKWEKQRESIRKKLGIEWRKIIASNWRQLYNQSLNTCETSPHKDPHVHLSSFYWPHHIQFPSGHRWHCNAVGTLLMFLELATSSIPTTFSTSQILLVLHSRTSPENSSGALTAISSSLIGTPSAAATHPSLSECWLPFFP